jgi:arsenate reductase (glutaredoxin)
LREVIKKLAIKPEALLRKGEDLYKQHFAGRNLSDAECITAMVEFPALIERPIVILGDRAVIGRPPERVIDLI